MVTRRLSQVRWAGGIALVALVLWPLPTATVGQAPSGSATSNSTTAERSSTAMVANRHPWGAFRVGAWKRVRVVTETLDGDGKVLTVSTTETTSTLEAVTDREIALRVASTIEIGGKSYPSPPQVLRQGFYGQAAGQVANVKKTTDSQVTINGQAIPCETFEVTVQGDDKKRVTLLQISEKHAPYVLGSATSMVKGEGQKPVALSMSEVVALNMPYKVLAETKSTAFVKTTHVRDDGRTITTLEIQAADVPGGIVAHTSKETDSQGRLVQRSTLELLDFGTESVPSVPRRRIFQRNRTRGPAAGNSGASERP
ncbi:MAG: hypothetical protein ACKOBW_18600 [Planctomycetota bacterium]